MANIQKKREKHKFLTLKYVNTLSFNDILRVFVFVYISSVRRIVGLLCSLFRKPL